MPTDVNVPRWRCDLCGTTYEGPDAHRAACWCESSPTPEPLPAGTWVLSSFTDLLDKAAWRSIEDHTVTPHFPYDDGGDRPVFDLTDVQNPHDSRRTSTRGVAGHEIKYATRLATPRRDSYRNTPIEVVNQGDGSARMWPHRPGVLNLCAGISEVRSGDSEGIGAALAVGRADQPSNGGPRLLADTDTTTDDHTATSTLLANVALTPDPRLLGRYLTGRRDGGTFTWGTDANAGRYLQPNLDGDVVDALLALCQDNGKGGVTARANLARMLHRSPADDPHANAWTVQRGWHPSHADDPHYGIASATRSRVYGTWLEAVALLDHDGDTAAALRWLTFASAEEHDTRLEAEVRAFLDGDTATIIPLDAFHPSAGMTRGPRAGLLRPEHKAAARTLGVDFDSRPVDVLRAHAATLTDTLAALGVTVPTDRNTPLFAGAPVITVTSGKGGVGKTTTAAALAHHAAAHGEQVLLIDADVTGPSLGALYQLDDGIPVTAAGDLDPTEVTPGLRVVSAAQALRPGEASKWGEDTTRMWLRFITTSPALTGETTPTLVIVDMPPGYTGQHRAVAGELRPTGRLLVTTGSRLAHADLTRALRHDDSRTRSLGVVESLSQTPSGERLYPQTATADYAADHDLTFLGSLPWDIDPATLADTAPIVAAYTAAMSLREPATTT